MSSRTKQVGVDCQLIALQLASASILLLFGLHVDFREALNGPSERVEVHDYVNSVEEYITGSGDQLDLGTDLSRIPVPSPGRAAGINVYAGQAFQGDWYIVIYPQTNYRGNPTRFNTPVSSLTGSSRRVGSITIGKGVWQFCRGNHFTGECITLDQSVPDLGTHKMRNRVSSLRPVIR